jgi:hypothetical protein
MTPKIHGVRACVFDAYGTLFNFASAATRCQDELGDQAGRLITLWRDKQLQYTWLRAVQKRHADFWQVTGDALDYAMDTLGPKGRVGQVPVAPSGGCHGNPPGAEASRPADGFMPSVAL